MADVLSTSGSGKKSLAGPRVRSSAGRGRSSTGSRSRGAVELNGQITAGPGVWSSASPTGQSAAGPSSQSTPAPSGQQGERKQGEGGRRPYLPTYVETGDICQVCADKTTGLHYGVMTCEGCKGFFRRIVQKYNGQPPNLNCKKEGNCVITVDTRNSCQHCRYKKCITVKMNILLVQNELKRKEEQKKKALNKQLKEAKKLLTVSAMEQVEINKIGSHYKCQHVLPSFWYPVESSKPDVRMQEALVIHAYTFVRNIPGVHKIPRKDFFMLVKHRLIDVLALQLSEVFSPEEQSLNLGNVQIQERDTLENETLKCIFNYAKHHSKFCTPEGKTMGLLCAITFLNAEKLDLTDPQTVQNVLHHILLLTKKQLAAEKESRPSNLWRLSNLCVAFSDFEFIREDKDRLIWKMTGMMENDRDIQHLILNDPPEVPMESVEDDDENPSGLLNHSASPSSHILPSTSISPNILAAALSAINSSSTTTRNNLVTPSPTPPSASGISSACTSPGSNDMATNTNEGMHECTQEANIERDHFHQPSGYKGPYLTSVIPGRLVKYQQRPRIMTPRQESSPPNVSAGDGHYTPRTHEQVFPLSSPPSPGYGMATFKTGFSPPLNTTNNQTPCGLDLSLRGENQAYNMPSLYRTPVWSFSNNQPHYTKNSLSQSVMGVSRNLHSPQDPTPDLQANIIATAESAQIDSLVKNFEVLKKELSYLGGEMEKIRGIKQEYVQKSNEVQLENPLHGFTGTQSSLSESASSPHFGLMDHPEVMRVLSTKLSIVNKIPSQMEHQLSQNPPLPHSSASFSRQPLIPSPDMPDNIEHHQNSSLWLFRPQTNQMTTDHYSQTVGYQNPLGFSPLKQDTLEGDQMNHASANYYTRALYEPAIKRSPGAGTATSQVYQHNSASFQDYQHNPASFQDYQHNPASLQDYQHNPVHTYNYPNPPSESLTLRTVHPTVNESNSAVSFVPAFMARTTTRKRSSGPETISLPIKKQQRNIGLKKKWLQAHLTEVE